MGAGTKWALKTSGVGRHSLLMLIDSGSLETVPCNATPILDRRMINTQLTASRNTKQAASSSSFGFSFFF